MADTLCPRFRDGDGCSRQVEMNGSISHPGGTKLVKKEDGARARAAASEEHAERARPRWRRGYFPTKDVMRYVLMMMMMMMAIDDDSLS